MNWYLLRAPRSPDQNKPGPPQPAQNQPFGRKFAGWTRGTPRHERMPISWLRWAVAGSRFDRMVNAAIG